MPDKLYKVLGLMSGTSLDGLDMAYCHFWEEGEKWNFEIRQSTTIKYPELLFEKLRDAVQLTEEEHEKLHEDYGIWLGEQVKSFVGEKGIDIDFISSHGHTSHHRPEEGITFQLGSGQRLADVSGHRVLYDFRTMDVELGGQGAPLVPIGDELLLSEYDFCLNLGGISNISFNKQGKRLAYDIGMANMPLNYLTRKIRLDYDEDGKLAKKGKLIPGLLAKLNKLEYYQLPYPKSTGIEWVSKEVYPMLDTDLYALEDMLHTLIHHNCEQIAMAIKSESTNESKVLVTGGGAQNPHFIAILKTMLEGICEVVVPPEKFIAFKEAMVFAFMGVLKELGRINVLASVTGATKDSSSGKICRPS